MSVSMMMCSWNIFSDCFYVGYEMKGLNLHSFKKYQ